MKETELKPCPFCGGEAFINYPMHNTVAIICSNWECGATISVGDARRTYEASERWNRRADNEQREADD